MNQLYKKNEYIVIPVEDNYIVINKKKIFEEGHTHIREMKIARLLIDLAIDKKLPRNPAFADRLIRITEDEEYINRLKKFREETYMKHSDFKKMMEEGQVCRRERGALRRVR